MVRDSVRSSVGNGVDSLGACGAGRPGGEEWVLLCHQRLYPRGGLLVGRCLHQECGGGMDSGTKLHIVV